MTTKTQVAVLSGEGASDSINGFMRIASDALEANGYTPHFFDIAAAAPEDMSRLVHLLASGEVRFGLTFLGIGQDLSVRPKGAADGTLHNLWDYTRVPLVKLHGDSPAYLAQRHGDFPRTGVNCYYFDEHLAFRRYLFPGARTAAALVDPYLVSDTPLAEIDFKARERGTLVFVKNGGDPRALMAMWREKLPESVSDQLVELAIEIEKPALEPGRFLIHEFVVRYLESKRVDPASVHRLVRLYVAQLDDYLRRVKATMIARALLPFPVVIQGAGWQHLDLAGAKARLVPPLDFKDTGKVFHGALGVVDMTPNADGCGHDRMFRAAGTYAFGLANRTTWLEGLLPELNARCFEFTPASIEESVRYALGHRDECLALGQAYGRAFRRRYDTSHWVDRLVELADMSVFEHDGPQPALQPYFVW